MCREINYSSLQVQCSPLRLTSPKLTPWLSRAASLSPTRYTLTSINFSCLTWPLISQLLTCIDQFCCKFGFFLPQISQGHQREKNSCNVTCLNQQVDTETSFLHSSVFLPSALRVARWQFVRHVCHSHTFTLNCSGVWYFIPFKA